MLLLFIGQVVDSPVVAQVGFEDQASYDRFRIPRQASGLQVRRQRRTSDFDEKVARLGNLSLVVALRVLQLSSLRGSVPTKLRCGQ